jgi:enediyne biosynthesis protein CalE5
METRSATETQAFIRGMWAHVAPAWGDNADDVDLRAAAITAHMLDAAQVGPADCVLELASGPGGAGLAAADRVGTDGHVLISDVVPEMVEIAARRAADQHRSNVTTEVLDLEDIDQPDAAFDVVLCREGMMFAIDPARAAREMHRVLRPHGRLAVAVWGPRDRNPWLGVLLDAITDVTGMVVPPPGVPGPFSLSDAGLLEGLFTQAGFCDVALDRAAAPLRSDSFESWWQRNLTVAGPVVRILNGLDEATRSTLRDRVRQAAARYQQGDGLELPGEGLVLTGRRP